MHEGRVYKVGPAGQMGTYLWNIVSSHKGQQLTGRASKCTTVKQSENKGNVAEAQQVVQALLKHSMVTDRKTSHEYCLRVPSPITRCR